MKLQLRFLLVLAVFFGIGSSLLLVAQNLDLQRSHHLLASELITRRSYYTNIVALTGHSQQALAHDYSFWDDMITFINGTNDTFAHENIDTGLATYEVDTAWVYRVDGSLRYFVQTDGTKMLQTTSLPTAFFKKLSSSNYLHFYLNVNSQLVEVQAATIVPSDDSLHHTPAQGFLLIGRIVDQSYLSSLATLSSSAIQLRPSSDVSDNIGLDTVSFAEPLKSWSGQTLATLRSTSTIPAVHDLRQEDTTQLRGLAGLAVLSIATISLLVWLLVLRPVATVSHAIQQQRPAMLEKLRRQKTEFGRLAQIVTDFFAQKVVLAKAELEKAELTEHANQLLEEKAKLRASIEGLEIGFILLDTDKQIVVQNHALQKILDRQGPIYNLATLEETFASLNLGQECTAVQQSQQPKELNDIQIGTSTLRVSISPVLVMRGSSRETIGTVLLVQDVSEQKILSRSHDEFFSIASHALRTPLATIRGNASMIIDQHEPALTKDGELKEMVEDIHDSSNQLTEIMADFFDASLLEQNKMEFKFEVVPLAGVIEATLKQARENLNDKRIELISNVTLFDKPPLAWADRARLTQVLNNLVNNAVTFTDSGEVAVLVNVTPETVELRVRDTGIGISGETQKLLFRKLQQASDSLLTRATTRGIGMSLYNSRLIAQHMGGSLELEHSEVEKGSTFLLTIPKPTSDQLLAKTNIGQHEKIDINTGMPKDDTVTA